MSDLPDPRGPWAIAIGRAFVAFGSIEFITLRCLEEIPKDRIKRSTRSFKLVQRIELIQELLEAHQGPVFEELSSILDLAKKLAPKRNLIAHNPIFLEISKREDGTFHYTQSIKAGGKSLQTLTLQQVEDFAEEADSLVFDLNWASIAVFNALRGGPVA